MSIISNAVPANEGEERQNDIQNIFVQKETENKYAFQARMRNGLYNYLTSDDFHLDKPTGDFYTLTLSDILDFAVVDYTGRVCIYFDDFLRINLENKLQCGKSCIKRYIKKLIDLKLLVRAHHATYFLDEELSSYLKALEWIRSNDNIQIYPKKNLNVHIALSKAKLPERTRNLFNMLIKYMICFQANRVKTNPEEKDDDKKYTPISSLIVYLLANFEEFTPNRYKNAFNSRASRRDDIMAARQLAKNKSDFFNILRKAGINKMPLILSNEDLEKLKQKKTDLNDFKNKYFVFITPEIRKAIMKETEYESTYFHIDLARLLKENILVKVSAYRFFLNIDTNTSRKLSDEELNAYIDYSIAGEIPKDVEERLIGQLHVAIREIPTEANTMLEQEQTEANAIQEQTQPEIDTMPEQTQTVTDSEIAEFETNQLKLKPMEITDATLEVIQLNDELYFDPQDLTYALEGFKPMELSNDMVEMPPSNEEHNSDEQPELPDDTAQ